MITADTQAICAAVFTRIRKSVGSEKVICFMPDDVEQKLIAGELGPETYVNVMEQHRPARRVLLFCIAQSVIAVITSCCTRAESRTAARRSESQCLRPDISLRTVTGLTAIAICHH